VSYGDPDWPQFIPRPTTRAIKYADLLTLWADWADKLNRQAAQDNHLDLGIRRAAQIRRDARRGVVYQVIRREEGEVSEEFAAWLKSYDSSETLGIEPDFESFVELLREVVARLGEVRRHEDIKGVAHTLARLVEMFSYGDFWFKAFTISGPTRSPLLAQFLGERLPPDHLSTHLEERLPRMNWDRCCEDMTFLVLDDPRSGPGVVQWCVPVAVRFPDTTVAYLPSMEVVQDLCIGFRRILEYHESNLRFIDRMKAKHRATSQKAPPVTAAAQTPATPTAPSHEATSQCNPQSKDEKQHPDGPEGGRWVWWKDKRHDVPEGNVYRMIEFMWDRDFASYDVLIGPVFENPIEPQTIRSCANRVKVALLPTGVPWCLKTDSMNRFITKSAAK